MAKPFNLPFSPADGARHEYNPFSFAVHDDMQNMKKIEASTMHIGRKKRLQTPPPEVGASISWGSNPVQYGVFVGPPPPPSCANYWVAFEYGK